MRIDKKRSMVGYSLGNSRVSFAPWSEEELEESKQEAVEDTPKKPGEYKHVSFLPMATNEESIRGQLISSCNPSYLCFRLPVWDAPHFQFPTNGRVLPARPPDLQVNV